MVNDKCELGVGLSWIMLVLGYLVKEDGVTVYYLLTLQQSEIQLQVSKHHLICELYLG